MTAVMPTRPDLSAADSRSLGAPHRARPSSNLNHFPDISAPSVDALRRVVGGRPGTEIPALSGCRPYPPQPTFSARSCGRQADLIQAVVILKKSDATRTTPAIITHAPPSRRAAGVRTDSDARSDTGW